VCVAHAHAGRTSSSPPSLITQAGRGSHTTERTGRVFGGSLNNGKEGRTLIVWTDFQKVRGEGFVASFY